MILDSDKHKKHGLEIEHLGASRVVYSTVDTPSELHQSLAFNAHWPASVSYMPNDKHVYPSIAQLEERGTVMCNLASALSRGRWFEPGSKDIFLIAPLISPIKQVVFHPSATVKWVSATILLPSRIITQLTLTLDITVN